MKAELRGTGVSLAIGPANWAGQAFLWAEAVKEHLGIPAVSFAPEVGNLQFPIHMSLGHPRWENPWHRRRTLMRAIDPATHLAIDGFQPVFGLPGMRNLARDCTKLRRRGVMVALVSHGSDTRDPDAHMEREPFSYYASAPTEYVEHLRKFSARNRLLAADLGLPMFVSTPDLLLDTPTATWLPLCVDIARWHTPADAFSADVPTVLHLPSKRVPPIKGTAFIDPVLRQLAEQGRIIYLSPDHVTNQEMPNLIRRSDVVVDQLLTGSYGAAAVEAMAAGRLVVGNVSSATRALIPDNPPIVDAPPDRFEEVIEDVLLRRGDYVGLAAGGRGYASRWHSGSASAATLEQFLMRRTE